MISFRPLLMVFLFGLVCLGSCGDENTPADQGSGSSKPISALPDYPIFPLDEMHNALWQDSAQIFLSRPSDRLALRPGDYAFHVPTDMNRPDILQKFGQASPVTGPNMVHVLYHDNLYKQPWTPSDGILMLRADALGPGQKNVPFSKFEAGNTVYILIGFEGKPAEAGQEAPFAPFYALRVLVDENPLRFIKQPGTKPVTLQ